MQNFIVVSYNIHDDLVAHQFTTFHLANSFFQCQVSNANGPVWLLQPHNLSGDKHEAKHFTVHFEEPLRISFPIQWNGNYFKLDNLVGHIGSPPNPEIYWHGYVPKNHKQIERQIYQSLNLIENEISL